jgi:hypothetical protein
MKNTYRIIFLFLFAMLVAGTGCKKFDDIENLDTPNTEDVLSSPEDVMNLAGGALNTWWVGTRAWGTGPYYNSLQYALLVMADQYTCSWGNFAMRDMSNEPRKTWNNSSSAPDKDVTESIWYGMYRAIFQANSVLSVLDGGSITLEEEDEPMVRAICYFIQGASHGYAANTFDQAFFSDEATAVEDLVLMTPEEVIPLALVKLDECIALCEANTFILQDGWLNGITFTNEDLGKLANSYAARIMIQSSRTAAQNDALNWSKVLAYAEKGITDDFYVIANGLFEDGATWYDEPKEYLNLPTWARIDCRIINMMDPEYPARYPADGSLPTVHNGDGQAFSDDARLESDFEFLPSNNFKPDRGYYHYSHYRYDRYTDNAMVGVGELMDMRKAENDMMIAEAKARLGDLGGAITIINEGTRVTRGELLPIDGGAGLQEVLDAIFYERDIELIGAGYGVGYFDMRRRDMLQKGSLLNWPLPAQELLVLQMTSYTFGGEANADGINTSNGGWFK